MTTKSSVDINQLRDLGIEAKKRSATALGEINRMVEEGKRVQADYKSGELHKQFRVENEQR